MSLKNLFRIEVSHYTTQRGGGLSNWRQFLLTGLVTSTKSGKNAREKLRRVLGWPLIG